MSANPVLALDLGGTQVRAAIIDSGGRIVAREAEVTLADAGPEPVIQQMTNLAARVRQMAGDPALSGVGVSSPGPLDTTRGVALDLPTFKGFNNFPLRDALTQAFAMPVALENDAITAAIGEWRFGAGQGVADLVYVTVSTGIGGGIIANNRPLRGARGMAGHLGHLCIVMDGERCHCGLAGCFEAYASGSAFTRRAIYAAKASSNTRLGEYGAAVDAKAVFAAAEAGDALAVQLVAEEARLLGIGFASLLHAFNPERIIMGGGLSMQFDVLHPGIVRAMDAHAMPAFRGTPLVKAALGADSGLLGAAHLAFEKQGLRSQS